jgi:hypothetical protein
VRCTSTPTGSATSAPASSPTIKERTIDIVSFTHQSRNENGLEEVVIEVHRSLFHRLFRRDHILTFEWRNRAWVSKKTGEPADDVAILVIYSYLNFGKFPC